ncbi:hypothetical protein EYF80_054514 [Liparis tanakae]|uniref:Uncharacterized protein n=1 Tax=Liparis tanakae TaxID=230148 RepID=A0A4Z2F2G2_9TELE|nr:hypothetical protein EYF80_054514 [Liparis tanakae]
MEAILDSSSPRPVADAPDAPALGITEPLKLLRHVKVDIRVEQHHLQGFANVYGPDTVRPVTKEAAVSQDLDGGTADMLHISLAITIRADLGNSRKADLTEVEPGESPRILEPCMRKYPVNGSSKQLHKAEMERTKEDNRDELGSLASFGDKQARYSKA